VSAREERRQARIARLLEQMQATAESWAETEYQTGLQDGRYGGTPMFIETRRATAERRFRNVAARLTTAISPPVSEEG
jgi:hypothetical protein